MSVFSSEIWWENCNQRAKWGRSSCGGCRRHGWRACQGPQERRLSISPPWSHIPFNSNGSRPRAKLVFCLARLLAVLIEFDGVDALVARGYRLDWMSSNGRRRSSPNFGSRRLPDDLHEVDLRVWECGGSVGLTGDVAYRVNEEVGWPHGWWRNTNQYLKARRYDCKCDRSPLQPSLSLYRVTPGGPSNRIRIRIMTPCNLARRPTTTRPTQWRIGRLSRLE